MQERLQTPVVGVIIDRRTFTHTAHVATDDRIVSLVCCACAQIKLDTGRMRSEIGFMTGRWLFSRPVGVFANKFSMQRFSAKYRKPGTPLA